MDSLVIDQIDGLDRHIIPFERFLAADKQRDPFAFQAVACAKTRAGYRGTVKFLQIDTDAGFNWFTARKHPPEQINTVGSLRQDRIGLVEAPIDDPEVMIDVIGMKEREEYDRFVEESRDRNHLPDESEGYEPHRKR